MTLLLLCCGVYDVNRHHYSPIVKGKVVSIAFLGFKAKQFALNNLEEFKDLAKYWSVLGKVQT